MLANFQYCALIFKITAIICIFRIKFLIQQGEDSIYEIISRYGPIDANAWYLR